MKVDMQKLENNKIKLQVEVDEAQVASALDQSFRKIVKDVSIPGFRKGKVPRAMLEARYGVEVLYEEAIDILLPEAYKAALDQHEIEAIDRPEVDVVNFQKGEPATFTFVVQTPPEVELGQYKGVEVEAVAVPFNQEDVEKTLANLQEQHARLVESPDEAVAQGDFAIIDFEGFVDGVAFAGGKGEDHSLEIGSGSFIPGFEEQLIGMKRDEEKEISVTFPEKYRNEELAGQPATFKVTVKDIKRKEIPELSDEFASEVSEFATLEELRTDIENKLQEAAARQERNMLETKVVDAVVANAQVEIPEVMIASQVDELINELRYNLSRQGFPREFAEEYIDKRLDSLKEDYREPGQERVKTRLVLQAIREAEGIEASEDDIAARFAEMAAQQKASVDEVRASWERFDQGLADLKASISMQKTVDLLVAEAKQIEKAEQAEETPAEEQQAE